MVQRTEKALIGKDGLDSNQLSKHITNIRDLDNGLYALEQHFLFPLVPSVPVKWNSSSSDTDLVGRYEEYSLMSPAARDTPLSWCRGVPMVVQTPLLPL